MTTIDNFKEITREEAQLLLDLGAEVYYRPRHYIENGGNGPPGPWRMWQLYSACVIRDLWVRKEEDETEEEVPNYRSCL